MTMDLFSGKRLEGNMNCAPSSSRGCDVQLCKYNIIDINTPQEG